MKSRKFYSSFKKIRRNVISLLHPFYSFRSNQITINKRLVNLLQDSNDNIMHLDILLDGHKHAINFLYERNSFLSKRLRFLQNAMIVISSILVGVIFYLFSIS